MSLMGSRRVVIVDDADSFITANRAALERLGEDGVLVRGYVRRQGLYFRRADFPEAAPTLHQLSGRSDLRMLNRTRGAGTRVLLDLLLEEIALSRPPQQHESVVLSPSVPQDLLAGIAGLRRRQRGWLRRGGARVLHSALAGPAGIERALWFRLVGPRRRFRC